MYNKPLNFGNFQQLNTWPTNFKHFAPKNCGVTSKFVITFIYTSIFKRPKEILAHFWDFKNARCPKTKLGIKKFPKEDFGGFWIGYSTKIAF